jgi:uncharacterized membrane protein YoaK (UPF0700 family)
MIDFGPRTWQAIGVASGAAMVAGFLDAFGMIEWSTYVSFMSGNTTQTGYRLGQGDWTDALPSAIAIISFLVGSFCSAFLTHSGTRGSRQLILCSVTSILMTIIGISLAGIRADKLFIAAIAFAMGLINVILPRIGAQSVNLSYVTGTLNRLATHLAMACRRIPVEDSLGQWDTHIYRASILASTWCSFFSGAVISGAATPRFGAVVLIGPVLVLFGLLVGDTYLERLRRS